MSVKRTIVSVLGGLGGLAAAAIGGLSVRFYLGRRCADCAWTTPTCISTTSVGERTSARAPSAFRGNG
jgi:hypothetical protein